MSKLGCVNQLLSGCCVDVQTSHIVKIYFSQTEHEFPGVYITPVTMIKKFFTFIFKSRNSHFNGHRLWRDDSFMYSTHKIKKNKGISGVIYQKVMLVKGGPCCVLNSFACLTRGNSQEVIVGHTATRTTWKKTACHARQLWNANAGKFKIIARLLVNKE